MNSSVIEYLLEKGEIKIPYAILKTETLRELDNALSSGIPVRVSKFYEKIAKEINNYLNYDEIKEILEILNRVDEMFPDANLSQDDLKIIEFLVKSSKIKVEDFLEMVGPIYNILKVAEELNKEKIESDYLRMFILTSSYVQIYELLLYQMDRRIYHYIKSKREANRKIKNFLKLNREHGQHATAGDINKAIAPIIGISERNNSIIGVGSKSKLIRNKISHANLFYDSKRKIIVSGNTELPVEDFISEYQRLLKFAIKWMEVSAGIEEKESDIANVIVGKVKDTFNQLSKLFLKIQRNPHYRKIYGNLIIEWKRGSNKLSS